MAEEQDPFDPIHQMLTSDDSRPASTNEQSESIGEPLWRCDHYAHDTERCTPTKHYGHREIDHG